MISDELAEAKRGLASDYLVYYGKPRERLAFREAAEAGYLRAKAEEREIRDALAKCEYPENLGETAALHFLYLRACVFLGARPEGDFEGDAKICAEVLRGGGGLPDMLRSGASAVYVSCLSHYGLDAGTQREIVNAHIPF